MFESRGEDTGREAPNQSAGALLCSGGRGTGTPLCVRSAGAGAALREPGPAALWEGLLRVGSAAGHQSWPIRLYVKQTPRSEASLVGFPSGITKDS